jgi:hypothetical protein
VIVNEAWIFLAGSGMLHRFVRLSGKGQVRVVCTSFNENNEYAKLAPLTLTQWIL